MDDSDNLDGQNLLEKNEIFKRLILNSELFSSFDFLHDGNIPPFTDEDYILEFNSSSNRTVKIQLRKGKIFGVEVSRVISDDYDSRFNYQGGHKSFYLYSWLDRTNYPYTKKQYPFYVSSYNGTFEEKVNEFLTFLENAFNDSTLIATIQGRDWGYFPFDWGSHK
jgi:hypothetical protein